MRDAVVDLVLPGEEAGLVALAPAVRRDFWARFDARAPLGLRLGFALAVALLAPLALWGGPAADRALQHLARWPGTGAVVLVAKVVAGLLWFHDAPDEAS